MKTQKTAFPTSPNSPLVTQFLSHKKFFVFFIFEAVEGNRFFLVAEGACGYKSGPTLGIQPTPSHHSKCKSPLCVKSCALSEFGISKEAWCFDSNFGIKHNYENRPLFPEGTYFLRKEETQRSCVCVCVIECAHMPAAHYIRIHFYIYHCVSSFFIVSVFFSSGLWWRWRTIAADHQSSGRNVSAKWPTELKTWQERALWAIRNCGNLRRNLLLEQRSPRHSQSKHSKEKSS